jgi:hypothetical protein
MIPGILIQGIIIRIKFIPEHLVVDAFFRINTKGKYGFGFPGRLLDIAYSYISAGCIVRHNTVPLESRPQFRQNGFCSGMGYSHLLFSALLADFRSGKN